MLGQYLPTLLPYPFSPYPSRIWKASAARPLYNNYISLRTCAAMKNACFECSERCIRALK
ncbi:unnamed protein product [Tenebrio molitor]|nr:unnamed protein product [Tenebrio molitor]